MKKILWFLTVFFMLFYTGSLKADNLDSTNVYKAILKVANLNNDRTQDTIVGVADSRLKFLPKYIRWGKDTSDHSIPDSLKLAQTNISYPEWIDFTGVCMLDYINQDTLLDIVLVLWGTLDTSSQQPMDTSIALVIFGKHGLNTISQINISDIDTFQIQPFVAMKLRMGHELTNSIVRDMSYKASYELNDINLDVDTSSHPPPGITDKQADDKKPDIRIYPNPAIYYTNVELNNIPPGTYRIQIISMQGSLLNEQQITSETRGGLIKQIVLSDIASGSYLLRIFGDNKIIGDFPIIVLH